MSKKIHTIYVGWMLVAVLFAVFCVGGKTADGREWNLAGEAVEVPAIPPAVNPEEPVGNTPTAGFDAARYIDVEELKPGMRGYGLTVFYGTEPEKFEVEVISILRHNDPGRDAILIRCHDPRFDIARGVQGVSGSPVFFEGRLAGAMAFGWPYGEEPLYGVTPIQEMLNIRSARQDRNPTGQGGGGKFVAFDRKVYQNLMAKELFTPQDLNRMAQQGGLAKSLPDASDTAVTGLVALPMPVVLGGFSRQTLDALQERIPGLNLQLGLQSVGSGGSQNLQVTMQPGSTVTIPLITGDMNAAVLGTVTEVVDDKIYGFGHAWNGTGASQWPMASGYIHTFISRTSMSFKLGDPTAIIGAIQADEATGIFGRLGAEVQMIPVQTTVHWTMTGQQEQFSMQIAQDSRIDATLAAMAAINTVLQKGDLPEDHTITYQLKMEFDNTDPFVFENISSDNYIYDLESDITGPLSLLLNNPWKEVKLTRVEMHTTIYDKNTAAAIRSVQIPQVVYQPGQTVPARVVIEPVRQDLREYELLLKLPDDLPEGNYQINIGSQQAYQQQMQAAQPQRFSAFTPQDVQQILQERLSIRRDKLYISIIMPDSGIAIEETSLPSLPGSKAVLLTDKSRLALMRRFQAFSSNSMNTDYIISGNANLPIEVRKK